MHELADTERLLEVVLQQACVANARRVAALHLVIGQATTLAEDSVRFYWDSISRGTVAEGARLLFRHVPTELLCLNCQRHYTPAQTDPACPACGSLRVRPIAGEEFYLEAIDIEAIDEIVPTPTVH